MSNNVQAVQEIFAAFGRGDVQFILDQLADDVEWVSFGPPEIPHAGARRGKSGALEFFQATGAQDYEGFEPREFLDAGDNVVVLGTERIRAKSTGRVTDNEFAIIFTFADGIVTRFRCYEDTAALVSIHH